jgi:hypothetical protein
VKTVNLELRHKICVLEASQGHSVSLVQSEHLSTTTDLVFANHVKINLLTLTTMLLLRVLPNAVSNVLMASKLLM